MTLIFLALGLVLIVEGLAYLLAPSLIERMLDALRMLPETARRQVGALALVTGLLLIWIAEQIGPGLPF
ncbi:DUF2065 domain-containing protein [Thalassococcus sp. S3]|uniref:DUF2065 domain-containing protein n=1 Tax=Thalassococcus sp. S3 TaxID=2017482 RepID=UPI00102471C7|nr:DUF2065 domain-containing protein [Thalassococcus sp. S3]QBF32739.1 DUF2065 domain-containing protein [Thalassococcus sp. S3]